MTVTILHSRKQVAPRHQPNQDDAEAVHAKWYHERELQLIAILISGKASDPCSSEIAPTQRRLYWQGPELAFPSPPIGLGRLETYTTVQRVAILQYSLFNWAVTEERKRFFGRRSSENNLQAMLSRVPNCMQGYFLPALATVPQVYDLLPESAIHSNQLATRCERPREAMAAAIANRARREAEAYATGGSHGADNSEAYAAMQAILTKTQALPSPSWKEDDRDYLAKPLRFLTHGPAVPIARVSNAFLAAPGAERFGSSPPAITFNHNVTVSVTIPPAIIDDTIISFGDDLYKPAPTFREGDWTCLCGTHNFAIHMQCIKLECRTPMSAVVPINAAAPMAASRSALGDPGDWFCDFCGLCNWTRRTFCLRCCPLDVDNIQEAIQKGIVHVNDPIIDILCLGDKRSRALQKKPQPGARCACFGPHHGTRCPQYGVGVDKQLWEQYCQAQNAILENLRAQPVKLDPMAQQQLHANQHCHVRSHGGGPRRR